MTNSKKNQVKMGPYYWLEKSAILVKTLVITTHLTFIKDCFQASSGSWDFIRLSDYQGTTPARHRDISSFWQFRIDSATDPDPVLRVRVSVSLQEVTRGHDSPIAAVGWIWNNCVTSDISCRHAAYGELVRGTCQASRFQGESWQLSRENWINGKEPSSADLAQPLLLPSTCLIFLTRGDNSLETFQVTSTELYRAHSRRSFCRTLAGKVWNNR